MPKITYRPEGAEEAQVWEFTFGRLMSPERIVIEKLTGISSWDEIQNQFWGNSTSVVGALMYVLWKRSKPELRPSDVVFCDDDYELDPTLAEKWEFLEHAEAQPEAQSDPEIRDGLAKVRAQLEAEDAETVPGDPDPKAPAA